MKFRPTSLMSYSAPTTSGRRRSQSFNVQHRLLMRAIIELEARLSLQEEVQQVVLRVMASKSTTYPASQRSTLN
jgi:hypothetical protein